MGLFAKVEFPTLFTLMALVTTIAILLWRSHRQLARQQRDRSSTGGTRHAEPSQPGHHLGAPHEMLRWEVEMHETARELSGQLDSKMGALEHLIREADRAAARLEAALRATAKPPDKAPAAGAATGEASSVSSRPNLPERQPTDQAEALKSASAAGHASTTRGAGQADSQPRPPVERRYEEIYLLADYGFDAPEIAHRVGSPVGEVELILGLRGKRRSPAGGPG